MTRFDEAILPTIEEVRAHCEARASKIVGECSIATRCVLTNVIRERMPDDAYVKVGNPLSPRRVELMWQDSKGHLASNIIWLTEELLALTVAFDDLGNLGTPITGAQVVPLCDRIIAERSRT